MKFNVFITSKAEEDLLEIYKYVYLNDSPGSADNLYKKLMDLISKLETLPERGHVLPELSVVKNLDYLEVHFKPYRIIYHIKKNVVFIIAVFDGRRQMQKLLEDRLLKN